MFNGDNLIEFVAFFEIYFYIDIEFMIFYWFPLFRSRTCTFCLFVLTKAGRCGFRFCCIIHRYWMCGAFHEQIIHNHYSSHSHRKCERFPLTFAIATHTHWQTDNQTIRQTHMHQMHMYHAWIFIHKDHYMLHIDISTNQQQQQKHSLCYHFFLIDGCVFSLTFNNEFSMWRS